MNRVAAAKAVGIYFGAVTVLGAWIGGIVWVGTTGRDDLLGNLIIAAPLVIILGALFVAILVVLPVLNMYDHFNRKGGK